MVRHAAGSEPPPRRPAGRDRAGNLLVSVPSAPSAIGRLRRAVDTFLAERGVSSVVVEDMQLVVSELATNAMMYGCGSTIEVTAELTDTIRLVVSNEGSAAPIPPADEWRLAPPTAVSGRGLGIVARLVDSVDVRDDDGRATVEIRRQLPDAGPDWRP